MWRFYFFCFFLFSTLFAQIGTLVLVGGGAEGEIGDLQAWSYLLYSHLLVHDLQQDGKMVVVIFATDFPEDSQDANWLPLYFEWIGKTLGKNVDARNICIDSRKKANNPELTKLFSQVDVVFLKGGDQGEYYDIWNDTLLETEIQKLFQQGGSIGGTSAGAMSLSEYCLTGSSDLTSADVLEDAHSSYLNDVSEPQTSGIHHDFFAFLPQCIVDTHYTQRGRMGRLLGLLAKSNDDFQRKNVMGIGIEQKTGIVIRQQKAEIIGQGEVAFIQETPDSLRIREKGHPLIYTHLRLDRLTHQHQFDLFHRLPLHFSALPKIPILPFKEKSVQKISNPIEFEYVDSLPSKADHPIPDSIGFQDAGKRERRGEIQEAVFRALYEVPHRLGFLVFFGGKIERSSINSRWIAFERAHLQKPELATIVIDSAFITAKACSSFFSTQQTEEKQITSTVAFLNLRVHVLAESSKHGIFLDPSTHQIRFQKK